MTLAVAKLVRAAETVALGFVEPDSAAKDAAVGLSELARAGVLWLGCSTGLAMSGGRYRRAAVDGLVGWALAEVVAGVLKRASRRPRPRLPGSGLAPRSSSMPSAHTAAGVAYAVAAGGAAPRVAAPLGVLAVGVGWSRLAVRRHFPTDVAAGAIVGVICGGTVVLARRRAPGPDGGR
jgi:undecaprenyl-diphosphatase